jgi:hypothetical protein
MSFEMDADVIVCGAGPAGATAARRLARGGARVALYRHVEVHRAPAQQEIPHRPTHEERGRQPVERREQPFHAGDFVDTRREIDCLGHARDSKVPFSATMVKIRRQRMFRPRYAVWDENGQMSTWCGRLGREGASADIDGERYEVRRDGRRRFLLTAGGRELAAADRSGRTWKVTVGGSEYELRRPSIWRSRMELRGPGGAVGSVYRERRTVMCDVPAHMSTPERAFVGFVVMALWNREAAAAGGASAGATA